MARDSFPEHLIPQREAFLQSVCEEPDDLATRLIFADWLEDHGDPDRAEFIRIQCELSGDIDEPARLLGLQARESELLRVHRRRWNGELHRLLSRTALANQVDSRRGLIKSWTYRRGFVEAISMQTRAFVQHPDVIFRLGPIKFIRLWESRNYMGMLAACGWLDRLETLELKETQLQREHLEILSHSPYLDRLQHLTLTLQTPVSNDMLQVLQPQQNQGLIILY